MSQDCLYTFYKQWGNNILLKYRKNGKSYAKVVDFYQPSLYFPCPQGQTPDADSIFQTPLKRKLFDSIKDAKAFVASQKEVSNSNFQGNNDFSNQFIIEFNQGKMPVFDPSKIRVGVLDIEVDSPDEFPEPSEAKHPINGITIYDNFTDTYYVIGDKDYVHDKDDEDVGDCNVEFYRAADEIDLLRRMLTHFHEFQYDLTSGWNSESFDMVYIVKRCFALLGEKFTKQMLSPFGIINFREFKGKFGKDELAVNIIGLPHLDYLEVYKKHRLVPRESYKLGFIGQEEEVGDKVSYDDEGSLSALYHNNPQKFYVYNIKDVKLLVKLDKKLGYFALSYTLSYYCLTNYEETLGTVKIWQDLVAKHLYNKGQVPPFSSPRHSKEPFEGAFVHPTVIGRHKWAISVDLNSLYPMNEIQYNIGPETYVPREELPDELLSLKAKHTIEDLVNKKVDLSILKKHDLCMTGNFEFYRRDRRSFFSEIKDELYIGRKVEKKAMLAAEREQQRIKKEMTDPNANIQELKVALASAALTEVQKHNLQHALKILLNAGYGAVGNIFFLYYKLENAEAITLSGQLINKWTHVRINNLLNKLTKKEKNRTLAGDTDSLYLDLSDIVEVMGVGDKSDNEIADALDKFMKEILSPQIDGWCEELRDYMNAVVNKMVWEREVIASEAIFVRKKGYAMKVIDSEGVRYETPKYKITGLEAVKARSYPAWARKFLKECYIIALNGSEDDIHEKVKAIHKEFLDLPVYEIALPRGINQINKYIDPIEIYKKGTPKHVKAAIFHNNLVEKLGLSVEKITEGSKVKVIELRKQNPTGQEVIAFNGLLPKEFGLDKYIARSTIYETSFLSPLRIFLEAIQWSEEPVVTLF